MIHCHGCDVSWCTMYTMNILNTTRRILPSGSHAVSQRQSTYRLHPAGRSCQDFRKRSCWSRRSSDVSMGCGCEVCVVNKTQPSIKGITCDHTLSTHHNKMYRTNVSVVGEGIEINKGITIKGHRKDGSSFPFPANLSIHGPPADVEKFVNQTPGLTKKNKAQKNRQPRDNRTAEYGTQGVTANAKCLEYD